MRDSVSGDVVSGSLVQSGLVWNGLVCVLGEWGILSVGKFDMEQVGGGLCGETV